MTLTSSTLPLVSCLLPRCGPITVIGRIVSAVVAAFNGCAGRSFPHIEKERLERIAPANTHGNSAPTVIFITSCFRVVAPLFRTQPRSISRRATFAVCPASFVSIFRVFTAHSQCVTTAGTCFSAPQRVVLYKRMISAIARALKYTQSPLSSCRKLYSGLSLLQNQQQAVSSAHQINAVGSRHRSPVGGYRGGI